MRQLHFITWKMLCVVNSSKVSLSPKANCYFYLPMGWYCFSKRLNSTSLPTVSPVYPWVTHPQIQSSTDWKYLGKKLCACVCAFPLWNDLGWNYLHGIYMLGIISHLVCGKMYISHMQILHQLQDIWASLDFHICGGSWNQFPQIPRDNLV